MNLNNYKKTPLYLVVAILTFTGILIAFSIEGWIDGITTNLRDDRIKLMIFLISSTLGPTLIYFVLLKLDNTWWKHRWSNFLIDIPDLNGWYFGSIKTIVRSEGNKDVRKECSIEIIQIGSDIKVNMYIFEAQQNHFSDCENIHSELCIDTDRTKIYYIYRNAKDQRKTVSSPPISIGTAELKFGLNENNELEIEGSYYNQRGNTGRIEAKFINSSIAKKFRRPQ